MKNNAIFKLSPFVSEKIWGYERWIVSTLKGGPSLCEGEKISLAQKLGGDYPLLLKVIQANERLSVQVHPADEYAARYENAYGKTECWYILEAEEGATLICGLKGAYGRSELDSAIKDNKLEPLLYSVAVQKGDFIFIPAGTVHAIQGGLRILEIQQPSDVTYRLYDWGRGRELHIEKSLDVIEHAMGAQLPTAALPLKGFTGSFTCPYFTVEKLFIEKTAALHTEIDKTECFFVLSGTGCAEAGGIKLDLQQEAVFMANPDTAIRFSGSLGLMRIRP